MKILFLFNGDEDYTTNEVENFTKFKDELVYYIESTLQWEYGNRRDFHQWLEDNGMGRHAGCFSSSGSRIDVLYSVSLETVKEFLRIWNKDFGEDQLVEYKIIY
jgi:hypothetical protein